MEATAAQQAHTAATHDSQEGGYISARSRSDAMRFEGGRDEMKGSAAAEERVDATAEEGDGFGMLEGLSGSVQRALPSLPAHEVRSNEERQRTHSYVATCVLHASISLNTPHVHAHVHMQTYTHMQKNTSCAGC